MPIRNNPMNNQGRRMKDAAMQISRQTKTGKQNQMIVQPVNDE